MNELNEAIRTAATTMSLILVFVTVLFDLRYKEIMDDLEKPIPDAAKELERRRHHQLLLKSLAFKCLPLVLFNGLSLYLFLPLVVKIISSSNFSLWNFDFLRTSFLFVSLGILIFFCWSLLLAYKLLKKIRASR